MRVGYVNTNTVVNTNYFGYIGAVGTNKPILNFVIDPKLLARIDEFWHVNRFATRSEGVRWLIEAALDKKLKPAQSATKAE